MNTALEVVAEAIDQNYDEDRYLPVYPADGSRCVDSAAARAVLAALREHWTSDGVVNRIGKDFHAGWYALVVAALFEDACA